MKNVVRLLAIIATLVGHGAIAEAQQPGKVSRIGFLASGSPSSMATLVEAFRQGLRQPGWVEGKNISIEYRYAEGRSDRLPDLAADLVRLKVDVIVAGGSTATRAAKKATGTIPIVIASTSDPVAAGLVASLARPGGNITGLSVQAPELGGKQLELLKQTLPQLSRVAVLGNPDGATYSARMKEIELAARALGLQIQPVELRGPNDLGNAFSAMAKGRAGGLIGLQSAAFSLLRGRVAELAAKSRLPAVYVDSEFVDAGGLMSYGPHQADLYRRAATYVDKILKGAKPADLPVEQPTKFELVLNLKTAKQIGLTFPPNVLVRADKVIK